jgi:hypothetical protein
LAADMRFLRSMKGKTKREIIRKKIRECLEIKHLGKQITK